MRKIALFLAAVLVIGSLNACSGNSTTEVQQSQSQTVSESQPSSQSEEPATNAGQETAEKEIEVLRIGVEAAPHHMDPMRDIGNSGIRVYYNIFETLLQADQKEDFENKPMLAEKWERVDDHTVEFQLRKGVKFHNGDEMTAKDIKYSFERLKSDLPNINLAASLMSSISKVEIVDDYTVRLITDNIDPILETRVASSWGSWILPADYIEEVGDEEFALKPVGTGPYKVVSFSPEKIVMERFEDYWGEKPVAKRVEYIVYPETAARITALMTGEVDLITQVPPDQIDVVKSQKGLNVLSKNISNMHLLVFNTQAGPLQDKNFRHALSLAIDRQMLVDTLWGGKAVIPRGHQYTEYGDMYFPDYPLPEYNPEKAKQLVEESSYNGEVIDYELTDGYYTFGNEAAEAIIDMWKQIGVNAQIKFVEKNDQYNQVANWSNSMRFPDPAGGLWLLWGPGSSASTKSWLDMPQEFIDKGNELTSIIDPERRKTLARELMEIWDEEMPATLLYYPFESWGIRDGLEWEPYSSQTIDLRPDNLKVVE